MSEQAQDQQVETGKEARAFKANFGKMVAILNGEDMFKPRPRIDNLSLKSAMEELLKEKKEEMVKGIKTDVKAVAEKIIAFNKFVADKRKEVEKAIEEKQKEINKECQAIFSRIEDVEDLERTYAESLSSAMDASPDPQS